MPVKSSTSAWHRHSLRKRRTREVSLSGELFMDPAVLIASLYVFALAAFLGYQVISRVPPLLHTPLMSATNAISGISLIGSLVIAGTLHNKLSTGLRFLTLSRSSTN